MKAFITTVFSKAPVLPGISPPLQQELPNKNRLAVLAAYIYLRSKEIQQRYSKPV